jgi:hypothetical protein
VTGLLLVSDAEPVPGVQDAREHAHVGDLLTRRAALDLEDRARQGRVTVARDRRKQGREGGHELPDPGAGAGRPEEDGMHDRPVRLCRECTPEPVVGDRQPLHIGGQERLVALGEALGHTGCEVGVGPVERDELGARCAEVARRAHRHDGRGEPVGDGVENPVRVGPGPVDLVHEDQRRDPRALQRSHEDAGLGLHAFDGRDHQHGAVEDVEHPLDLGDEVGVARCVEQVDRDVVDEEGHDGGLDRDAALAFERERVGLGAAVVDAADLVDGTGGVEQPLGQARLPGVNMSQDPKVQRPHAASCPFGRWKPFGLT